MWSDDEMQTDSGEFNKQVIQLVLVNPVKKIRVTVQLKDENNNEVELQGVVNELLDYISAKVKDPEENSFVTQVYPLMAGALAMGMTEIVGPQSTDFLLTNDLIKNSYMTMMSTGFLLLQYIKQHNYSIHTVEEELSDDEVADWQAKTLASSIQSKAALLGIDYKLAIAILCKKGDISLEEAGKLLGNSVSESDIQDIYDSYRNMMTGVDNDEDDGDDSN